VPSAAAHQTTGNRTISVKHNSLGLRERELSDIPPDRIFFLGDSFTYGYDADVNERFSDLLQKELPQYGIVNAGVSGYGTEAEAGETPFRLAAKPCSAGRSVSSPQADPRDDA
jgi:lysophospholipase L1-like esterase